MHLLFLAACSGKDADSTAPEETDTAVDEGCTDDDECGDAQICEVGDCVAGDRNNTVDEAESLLWSEPVDGVLNPDDDVDYYTFTAEGGEYIRVATTVDGDTFDTVLTIRDATGKVVTTADAFATNTGVTGVDAVAFAYLESAGAYSISVEDIGTYTGEGGYGVDEYVYTLQLDEWEVHTFDADASDSPSVTVDLTEERIWYSVGTLLESTGDSDWIAVVFPTAGQNLYVDGNQDITGSDLTPVVRLYDEAGTLLGEKTKVGVEDYLLGPHLGAGSYLVEIADAGGAGGSNHWTFLHLIARADSEGVEFVEEVEPNGTVAEAYALATTEYENSAGYPYSQALGLGWADAPADEDWYTVTSSYNDTGLVVCLVSGYWGSLLAPTIGLYDATGSLIAEDVGSGTTYPTANLEGIDVPAGTYTLRVTAPKSAAGTLGEWYRFYWYFASFSVASYSDGGYACP